MNHGPGNVSAIHEVPLAVDHESIKVSNDWTRDDV